MTMFDNSFNSLVHKRAQRLMPSLVALSFAVVANSPAWAQPALFEEVSNAAGISYQGQSWGSAWGDFNGDGWFDLWVTNHGELPFLFVNQQDGTFVDIAEQVIPADVWTYYQTTLGSYDSHGSMWLDVDRDGDVDLFQGADGNNRNQPNQLLINNNGMSFADEIAFLAGVAANTISVRRPVALDFNGDGFVDIVTANSENSALKPPLSFYQSNFQQGDLTFTEVTSDFGLVLNEKPQLAFISDLDHDNKLEITAGPTPNFMSVYEFDQNALVEITADLNLIGSNYSVDGATADFDGDLDFDIYAVRGEGSRDLIQVDSTTIEATVYARNNEEGISFTTEGDITISIFPNYQVLSSNIYIGETGFNPPLNIDDQAHVVELTPDDTLNHGMAPHIAGETYGHYVGYDPDLGQWTLLVSATDARADRNVVVTSTAPVTQVEAIGFAVGASAASDRYYRNNNGSYILAGAEAGFIESSSARSVAAGDFDNDTDIDLYVVSTGPIQNNPNILYLNDGDGVFTKATEHGAEGPIEGRGDSVSMADFDNDGFLDLFVSNGKDKSPFYLDGPYVLFHNLGNGNHWVQMDLTGTVSEIQGIGSTIITTTNGVSQIRIHGNDTNGRSQHMIRSHFGLNDATIIDEIHVTWPSGHEKKLQAVAVDQILDIVEPARQDDSDADGLADSVDNCLNASNPDQLDSDKDGFGNVCDADFDNSCSVNFIDFNLLTDAFLSAEVVFDLNVDGTVNFLDVAIFVEAFLQAPGPSGTSQFCLG